METEAVEEEEEARLIFQIRMVTHKIVCMIHAALLVKEDSSVYYAAACVALLLLVWMVDICSFSLEATTSLFLA